MKKKSARTKSVATNKKKKVSTRRTSTVKERAAAAAKKRPDAARSDFAPVFAALKAIMKPYEARFRIVHDTETEYILETTEPLYRGRPLWLGGPRVGKAYVSYHQIALYMFPELAKNISPELRKRMQGKACFNFSKTDEALFRELAGLTAAGFEKIRTSKHLPGNQK